MVQSKSLIFAVATVGTVLYSSTPALGASIPVFRRDEQMDLVTRSDDGSHKTLVAGHSAKWWHKLYKQRSEDFLRIVKLMELYIKKGSFKEKKKILKQLNHIEKNAKDEKKKAKKGEESFKVHKKGKKADKEEENTESDGKDEKEKKHQARDLQDELVARDFEDDDLFARDFENDLFAREFEEDHLVARDLVSRDLFEGMSDVEARDFIDALSDLDARDYNEYFERSYDDLD